MLGRHPGSAPVTISFSKVLQAEDDLEGYVIFISVRLSKIELNPALS